MEFLLRLDTRSVAVVMPELPLECVRWLAGDHVHCPPRVLVGSDDWDWPFAVDALYASLSGPDEDEQCELSAAGLYRMLREWRISEDDWRAAKSQLDGAARQ